MILLPKNALSLNTESHCVMLTETLRGVCKTVKVAIYSIWKSNFIMTIVAVKLVYHRCRRYFFYIKIQHLKGYMTLLSSFHPTVVPLPINNS